jgi:DNA replication licensing factor MCM4
VGIKFISKYLDKNVAGDEQFDGMDINEPYYLQRLEEVRRTFENKFIIEKTDLNMVYSFIYKVIKFLNISLILMG